jgi:hypothetical protein
MEWFYPIFHVSGLERKRTEPPVSYRLPRYSLPAPSSASALFAGGRLSRATSVPTYGSSRIASLLLPFLLLAHHPAPSLSPYKSAGVVVDLGPSRRVASGVAAGPALHPPMLTAPSTELGPAQFCVHPWAVTPYARVARSPLLKSLCASSPVQDAWQLALQFLAALFLMIRRIVKQTDCPTSIRVFLIPIPALYNWPAWPS